MQDLHERLPGGDAGTREFSREVDLGCDLLGAGILEEMRSAANHQFFGLVQDACVLVLLVVNKPRDLRTSALRNHLCRSL
jgi:hypothetical protein